MSHRLVCFVISALVVSASHSIATAQGLPNLERRSISHVAGDVYLFYDNLHTSVFMVTDEGVIATDPITPAAAQWLNDEIEQRFGQSVEYVIYSHDHFDHVSGGAAFEGATIIAHANARAPIAASEHPIAMPNITFDDQLNVELGGKRVELFHLGPGHSESMIFMRFPEEGILFVVDALELGMVPFRDFPGDDIGGILSSLSALADMDFEIIVAGHSLALDHVPVGTPDELVRFRDYIATLMQRVESELASGKSVEEIKAVVTMAEYQDLMQYDAWQPLNVEGMARYLSAQQ